MLECTINRQHNDTDDDSDHGRGNGGAEQLERCKAYLAGTVVRGAQPVKMRATRSPKLHTSGHALAKGQVLRPIRVLDLHIYIMDDVWHAR